MSTPFSEFLRILFPGGDSQDPRWRAPLEGQGAADVPGVGHHGATTVVEAMEGEALIGGQAAPAISSPSTPRRLLAPSQRMPEDASMPVRKLVRVDERGRSYLSKLGFEKSS